MKLQIDVPDYSPERGLRVIWEPDHRIVARRAGEVLVIEANGGGLVTLARLLLTLAQPQVPDGHHIHLDASNGLEDNSCELLIARVSDPEIVAPPSH